MKTILGKLDELDSQVGTYWGETKGELKELKGARDRGIHSKRTLHCHRAATRNCTSKPSMLFSRGVSTRTQYELSPSSCRPT